MAVMLCLLLSQFDLDEKTERKKKETKAKRTLNKRARTPIDVIFPSPHYPNLRKYLRKTRKLAIMMLVLVNAR